MEQHKKRALIDGLIIIVSICVAIYLAQGTYIDSIIAYTKEYYILTAFVAGLFFTSAFTTAPAIAMLAKLSLVYPIHIVALVGGIGALLGDLLIFSFIKGHIREDVDYFLSKAKSKRIRHLFHHRFFRWSLAFIGAIIIASPLPDELGLALMGLSNVKTEKFVFISLFFNTLGIILIAFIANSI
jgi:hypothetical protein